MKRSHRIAPALVVAVTALAPLTASAYELKVPWRGDSLPQLSYMWTKGHKLYNCTPDGHGECGLDIFGVRWDNATNQYTPNHAGATSPIGRSDDVAWGMPLYAPVDGEIISCFRNVPDDNEDGTEPAACPGTMGASNTCAKGGNHVVIRTFDDHIVSLAHLQQDSIPEELCPIADALLFADSPKLCNLPGWHDVLIEGARLDHRGIAPIPVRKGDFIGRVGLSGNVNGVHLHMSTAEITLDADGNTCGLARPVEFVEAWTQELTSGVAPTATGWDRLSGAELAIDGTTQFLLWPDPLGPRVDELSIGYGTAPALVLTPPGGVAAYRNQAGNLAVNAMLFGTNGQVTLGVPEEEGAIGDVALSTLGNSSRHVIAAVRNGATKLQLIPYYVTTTAGLVRGVGRTESTAGAGQVEATEPPAHDGIVVAMQNSSNAISVISYGATFTGAEEITVSRLGSAASSTAISDVAVATVTQGRGQNEWSNYWQGVVTVERRSSDNTLWVRSWQIDSTGSTVTLVDSEQARDIDTNAAFTVSDVDVSVVRVGGPREVAVVSAATSSGLRVQTWQISSAGQLSAIDQWNAGSVTEVSSAKVGISDTLVSARTSSNSLIMMSFNAGPDGELGRVGTRWGGSILGLDSDGIISGSNAAVLTLSPTSEVTLTRYFTNYSSQH